MWDLETIIRMNEARRTIKKEDSPEACLESSIKRNERVFDTKERVFDQSSYVRSVYEGERDGCSPQSGTGETLP
jgi:hypothetical protein